MAEQKIFACLFNHPYYNIYALNLIEEDKKERIYKLKVIFFVLYD